MKFIAGNIAKKIVIALIVIMTIFAGIYASPTFKANAANKVHKVKGEPIYIMKDKDMFYLKPKQIKKDTIYIEKMDSILEDNKGNGHVISMPFYEMDFDMLMEERKIKLKKNDRVRTFFIHNVFDEKDTYCSAVVRFDFLRTKKKVKKGKKTKWVYYWKQFNVTVMQ